MDPIKEAMIREEDTGCALTLDPASRQGSEGSRSIRLGVSDLPDRLRKELSSGPNTVRTPWGETVEGAADAIEELQALTLELNRRLVLAEVALRSETRRAEDAHGMSLRQALYIEKLEAVREAAHAVNGEIPTSLGALAKLADALHSEWAWRMDVPEEKSR